MSFGYGVGDFLSVGRLAWDIYKSCKDAPESFGNIALEVLSLHAVLKEAEETAFAQPLHPAKQARLKVVGDGCYHVLEDLQSLIRKYESLGTRSKRTWDRMKWGAEDVAELRLRLISNATLLTAWISTSQVIVEKKLNEFKQEVRDGSREGSVISTQTIDSLSAGEGQVWRAIRKELEDIGVTVAAFDANREFIIAWFTYAVASGAFCAVTEFVPRTTDIEVGRDPAPTSHVTASPPIIMGTSNVRPPRKDTIENITPVPFTQHVPTRRRCIPQIAALIADAITCSSQKLILATKEGDLSKAKMLLRGPMKWGLLDNRSLHMIMLLAAKLGREEFVRLLLENGANVNATGTERNTALHYAAIRGDEHIVRLLLDNGADVNAMGERDNTALRYASDRGDEHIVRLLLDNGANVNATGESDYTALHYASQYGHGQVARLLLDNGANVNATAECGNTALHFASKNRHEQVVRLLLDNSADVNATAEWDITALHYASKNGQEQVVRLLLANGADVNITRKWINNAALHYASMNGYEQVVQLLLNNGADVNAPGGWDNTAALHYASENGHEQVVRLLLDNGADVNATAKWDNTALHYASMNGHERVVRLLLRRGADVNARGYMGDTALYFASENGNKKMVRVLLKYGAINTLGPSGNPVLGVPRMLGRSRLSS